MNQKERTKRDEELAKAAGLVKVHPYVPAPNREHVLDYCKRLRDAYGLEKGGDDE